MAEPKPRKAEVFVEELREALTPLFKEYNLTSIRIEAKVPKKGKVRLKFKTGPFHDRF